MFSEANLKHSFPVRQTFYKETCFEKKTEYIFKN